MTLISSLLTLAHSMYVGVGAHHSAEEVLTARIQRDGAQAQTSVTKPTVLSGPIEGLLVLN